jgi:hypothetical protein
MNRLPKVLQREISEYVRGDQTHWRSQFRRVIDDLDNPWKSSSDKTTVKYFRCCHAPGCEWGLLTWQRGDMRWAASLEWGTTIVSLFIGVPSHKKDQFIERMETLVVKHCFMRPKLRNGRLGYISFQLRGRTLYQRTPNRRPIKY